MPDGVADVVAEYPGIDPVRASVSNDFFVFDAPAVTPGTTAGHGQAASRPTRLFGVNDDRGIVLTLDPQLQRLPAALLPDLMRNAGRWS